MVDEVENNIENEEDGFPSFLRSDNQENDINHFLDNEDNSSIPTEVPIDLGAWNDGFEDEEKSANDIDLNLDNVKLDLSSWDNIEEDSFLKNPADIDIDTEIDLDIFADTPTTEPEYNDSENLSETTSDSIIADTTELTAPAEASSDDTVLDILEPINEEDTTEVKYVDPEEYMSSNVSLEELSNEETLMEEYAEREPLAPSEGIKRSSKNLGNTFIDDLPPDESENYVSLIVPRVKHTQKMSGPDAAVVKTHKKKEQEKFMMCQKYAGKIKDIYFEFSPDCQESAFAGNAVQNSIYVNIGVSAYGWNVSFDNGINMNLADVRIFQLRNGRLPADSGTLSYGSKKLRFSKVERIVVANLPEYFTYGV